MSLNKTFQLLSILILLAASGCSSFNSEEPEIGNLVFKNKYENGNLYQTREGKINVLVLEGRFQGNGQTIW